MAIFSKQFKVKDKMVTIRNAQPEDAAELVEVMNQLYSETVFLSREPGEINLTVEQERAFIEDSMDEYHRFAVVEVDRQIVGTCSTAIDSRRSYRHMAGIGIALFQAYGGMGIGRLAMEDAIAWLRSHDVERIELVVDTQNIRALKLYMGLGFVVEGLRRHERKLSDGGYRDAYWMALDLTRTK